MSVKDLPTYPEIAQIVQDFVNLKHGTTRHGLSLRGMLTKLHKVAPYTPTPEQLKELLAPIEHIILDDIKNKLELSQLSILNQDLVWLRDLGLLDSKIIDLITSYKVKIIKKILSIIKEDGIKKGYAYIDLFSYVGIGNDWPEFDIIQKAYKKSLKESDAVRRAFGGSEYNIIRDMGYNFFEKLNYYNSLNDSKYQIPRSKLPAINNAIGRTLRIVYLEDVIRPVQFKKYKKYFPQNEIDVPESLKNDETFVLVARNSDPGEFGEYNRGDMFLVNRTGANKYFRMWAKIV